MPPMLGPSSGPPGGDQENLSDLVLRAEAVLREIGNLVASPEIKKLSQVQRTVKVCSFGH